MVFSGSKYVKSKQILETKSVTRRKSVKKCIYSQQHKPWTRSLTKQMENVSFSSIPLRKTNKNISFKSNKKNNNVIDHNKRIFDDVKPAESTVILFDTFHKQFSTSSIDLPADLQDIKLYPLHSDDELVFKGFSNDNDKTENTREIRYKQRFRNSLSVLDMDIEELIELYKVRSEENNNFVSPTIKKIKKM